MKYVLLIDRSGKVRYFSADENAAIVSEAPKLIAEH